jgi:hypothetical protein
VRRLERGLLRVTKDVARKFGSHGVVGREVADPVDLLLVDEAHLGEVVTGFIAVDLANLKGETGVFVIALLPIFEALAESFIELFVGLKDEDPIVAAVHGISTGSNSGDSFADGGTEVAGHLFEFVVVGIDDDYGFVADTQRVESTFERAGMVLRMDECGDLGHV